MTTMLAEHWMGARRARTVGRVKVPAKPALAILLVAATGCRTPSNEPKELSMSRDARTPYYQLVFIQVRDAEKFGRYLGRMRPIVLRYGGALERMLAPEVVYAEWMAKPDAVNVVYYDDKEAFQAFNRDPAFREIEHLRAESIEMRVVSGVPISGEVAPGDAGDRLYVVEVARYGARGVDGYRAYEAEADPVMARYGYHVERVLAPDAAVGFPFEPTLVKVAYFDRASGMDRLHQDPAHERLEKELYPAAVSQSVWLIGRVHPSTLGAGAP
jgi:uncharacterized protein (DUF1330 family)